MNTNIKRTILITGKRGSGKSSLINSLVIRNVAEKEETLTSPTLEIQSYRSTDSDPPTDFFVVHSSEFQDANEQGLQNCKQELVSACPAVDLVVYCIDMTTVRIDPYDKAAIQHLTDCFSTPLWEKAIFSLTFANRLETPPSYEGTDDKFFGERVSQFKYQIQKMLSEASVPHDIVQKIPVIPTGYPKSTLKNRNPWNLPGQNDWFNSFWSHFITRIEGGACLAQLNMKGTNATIFIKQNVGVSITGSLIGGAIGAIIGLPAGGIFVGAGAGAVVGLVLGGGVGGWLSSRK